VGAPRGKVDGGKGPGRGCLQRHGWGLRKISDGNLRELITVSQIWKGGSIFQPTSPAGITKKRTGKETIGLSSIRTWVTLSQPGRLQTEEGGKQGTIENPLRLRHLLESESRARGIKLVSNDEHLE